MVDKLNWDGHSLECVGYNQDYMDNMKPREFYFELSQAENEPSDFDFTLVPIGWWQTNGCYFDHYIPSEILPDGFYEECESNFGFDGPNDVGRNLLLAAGFVEKDMFSIWLNDVKKYRRPGRGR